MGGLYNKSYTSGPYEKATVYDSNVNIRSSGNRRQNENYNTAERDGGSYPLSPYHSLYNKLEKNGGSRDDDCYYDFKRDRKLWEP